MSSSPDISRAAADKSLISSLEKPSEDSPGLFWLIYEFISQSKKLSPINDCLQPLPRQNRERLLCKKVNSMTILHFIVYFSTNDVRTGEILDLLLRYGYSYAHAERKDNEGNNPLHLAAINRKYKHFAHTASRWPSLLTKRRDAVVSVFSPRIGGTPLAIVDSDARLQLYQRLFEIHGSFNFDTKVQQELRRHPEFNSYLNDQTAPLLFTPPLPFGALLHRASADLYRGHLHDHGEVAIKVLGADYGDMSSLQEAIINEIRIYRLLSEDRNHHPNIIQIHGYIKHPSYGDAIILERMDCTLEEKISRRRLSDSQAIRILEQVVAGLHFLHSKSIFHTNFKSDNIMLSNNEEKVKIADYGFSRSLQLRDESGKILPHYRVGTPRYMAPEVFKGQRRHTGAVDIYAFGMVLIDILYDISVQADNSYRYWKQLKGKILSALPPLEDPTPTRLQLFQLAKFCLDLDPSRRPDTTLLIRYITVERLRQNYLLAEAEAENLRQEWERIATEAENLRKEHAHIAAEAKYLREKHQRIAAEAENLRLAYDSEIAEAQRFDSIVLSTELRQENSPETHTPRLKFEHANIEKEVLLQRYNEVVAESNVLWQRYEKAAAEAQTAELTHRSAIATATSFNLKFETATIAAWQLRQQKIEAPNPLSQLWKDSFLLNFEISHHDVQSNGLLTKKGGTAEVHFGLFHGTDVAIKVLHNAGNLEDLKREVRTWCRFHHPNILPLIGFSATSPRPFIVMELMHGDLYSHLHDQSSPFPRLSFSQRLRVACCVASGLTYIHDHRAIHRDIKSLNILLKGDFNIRDQMHFDVKIADFGATRGEVTMQQTTSKVISFGYSAPELFKAGTQATFASDVFAFAMVMYELVMQQLPYPHPIDEHHVINALLVDKTRPQFSAHIDGRRQVIEPWIGLIKQCWVEQIDQRPSSRDILTVLLDISKISSPNLSAEIDYNNLDVIYYANSGVGLAQLAHLAHSPTPSSSSHSPSPSLSPSPSSSPHSPTPSSSPSPSSSPIPSSSSHSPSPSASSHSPSPSSSPIPSSSSHSPSPSSSPIPSSSSHSPSPSCLLIS